MANLRWRAGRRTIGLPSELTEILQEHWKQQTAERVAARQLWKDEGWMFATRTGEALSPNMDYREWKDILATAEIRDGRLHDARHTAATVLLLLGVPQRAVMDGLVLLSDGEAVPAHHRACPHGHCRARRRAKSKPGKKRRGKAKKKGRRGDEPAGASVPA